MSFVCPDSCENGTTREKTLAKCSGKSPFSVSWVPMRCSGIFYLLNAWTNMKNKMMEEKEGLRGRIPRKYRKKEHACSVLEVFVVSDLSARQYLKVACPNRKIQSSSKLRQVQKGKAEIPDTQLGLTGTGLGTLGISPG